MSVHVEHRGLPGTLGGHAKILQCSEHTVNALLDINNFNNNPRFTQIKINIHDKDIVQIRLELFMQHRIQALLQVNTVGRLPALLLKSGPVEMIKWLWIVVSDKC